MMCELIVCWATPVCMACRSGSPIRKQRFWKVACWLFPNAARLGGFERDLRARQVLGTDGELWLPESEGPAAPVVGTSRG